MTSKVSFCLAYVRKFDAAKFRFTGEATAVKELNKTANASQTNFLFLDLWCGLNKLLSDLTNWTAYIVSSENFLGTRKLHHFNSDHYEIFLWYNIKQTQLT